MTVWWTVHGHFGPDGCSGRRFNDEEEAREFALLAARDEWADHVVLVRHETLRLEVEATT